MGKLVYAAFAVLCLSHFSLQETDEDTVEVEPDVDEVKYISPTPSGSYYLSENFDDPARFKKKWVLSQARKDGVEDEVARYDGVWELAPPVKDGLAGDSALVLKSKAKHAAISSQLEKVFHFTDKPLVVQYEVNFQEGQECGGAYLKLLSQGRESADLRQFVDKTPYTIMFGPDKCGNDMKLHFIFRHKNPNNGSFEEKHCKKPKERLQDAFEDKKPHLYTLIINPDNTFQVKVDHKVVNEGSLLEDFTPAVNPPPEIDDPHDKKPADWDEREQIPDPEARKPEDWDEDAPKQIEDPSAIKPSDWLEGEPIMIPDPDAVKPQDWDTDMDGDWEAPLVDNPACEKVSGCGKWEIPMIDNPAYKGKWRPSMIDNPNYQGKWRPRRIPNPDFFHDKNPFRMTSISAVGFELWSMSPSILFDNILITDSPAVADDFAAKSYDLKRKKIDADSESVLTSFLKYSNDRPYLYGVYIVLVGLPIALIVVYCCGSPVRDSEDDRKKTDAPEPDDLPQPARSKSELGVPEEPMEANEEEGEEEDDEGEEEEEEGEEEEAPEGASELRQRK